jgi:hypothetical protein
VALISQSFTENEVKYPLIEKHALALVMALRKFRQYVMGKHTIVKVPLPSVKYLLSQTFLQGKMANWLAKIQEFDLEIMVTKTVRGRDLALLLAENS